MDCRWNKACGEQSLPKPRPIAETLSKLAELMARVEHKQEGRSLKSQHSTPSISKDCQEISDLNSPACHQQREHVLCKPHCCQHCGQEFALAFTLQQHRGPNSPLVCQMCKDKPQQGSTCTSCLAEASGSRSPEEQSHQSSHRLHLDSSLYACVPCGGAFSHKQDLLHHQQARGCQPAMVSPKAFASSPAVLPLSPDDAPTPSDASLPPSPSGPNDYTVACSNCPKTFRTVKGLTSHKRLVHQINRKKKTTVCKRGSKGTLFPCRSCDRVFSQTSMLYLHRKEQHRRETSGIRQQKSHAKSTRQRQKSETYPCSHCGKVFLHHLTRWAHFKTYNSHYQSHLANSEKSVKMCKPTKNLKTKKGLKHASKPSKRSRRINKKTNKNVKKHLLLRTRKQISDKKDAVRQDEDVEFPCPSCEEVFKTQCALRHHEEIHQASHASKHCSVCTGGINLPDLAKCSVHRVYHCVPCKKAFVDIDTFLQHCKTHLHLRGDNRKSDRHLSDD